jgi:hypothetical protein
MWAPLRREGGPGPGCGTTEGEVPPIPPANYFSGGVPPPCPVREKFVATHLWEAPVAACQEKNFVRPMVCGRKNRDLTHCWVGG